MKPSDSPLAPFILSLSGWRKTFQNALHPSSSPNHKISPAAASQPFKLTTPDNRLLTIAALTFAHYFKTLLTQPTHKIVIARDSRQSGPAIIAILQTIFNQQKLPIIQLGITSIPEVLACVKAESSIQGWIYVTASHNPKHDNGFKLGASTGEVFPAKPAHALIALFKRNVLKAIKTNFRTIDPHLLSENLTSPIIKQPSAKQLSAQKSATQSRNNVSHPTSAPLYGSEANLRWRLKAHRHYQALAQRLAVPEIESNQRLQPALSKSLPAHQTSTARLKKALKTLPHRIKRAEISILINYNGSARVLSSEKAILTKWGVTVHAFHTTPGDFKDIIVPEGPALRTLKQRLSAMNTHTLSDHSKHSSRSQSPPLLGLQCDADGDRGNLVVMHPHTKRAYALGAQCTFALTVLARLAILKAYFPAIKPAVIANGATSLLIRDLVHASGGHYVQSETGESNVLSRAARTARQGYAIALAGEGSNGGNILPPATVRDPLVLILSLLELLFLNPFMRPLNAGSHSPRTTSRPALAQTPISPISAAFEFLANLHAPSPPSIPNPTDPSQSLSSLYSQTLSPHMLFHALIERLNRYVTTDVVDPKTLLHLPHSQAKGMSRLKKYYARDLSDYFRAHLSLFNRTYGIYALSFALHLGANTRLFSEPDAIPLSEAGGFSVYLKNRHNKTIGFLWFRASQTEPVLRTLGELAIPHVQAHLTPTSTEQRLGTTKSKTATQKLVQSLLALHHRLIRKAAKRASHSPSITP